MSDNEKQGIDEAIAILADCCKCIDKRRRFWHLSFLYNAMHYLLDVKHGLVK